MEVETILERQGLYTDACIYDPEDWYDHFTRLKFWLAEGDRLLRELPRSIIHYHSWGESDRPRFSQRCTDCGVYSDWKH